MNNIYDGTKQSVSDIQEDVLHSFSNEGSQSIETNATNPGKLMAKNNFLINGELFTLKVLFIDIFVILCALVSDFVQATSIFIGRDDITFALFAYLIIWIPGIPTAVHYLAVFRHRVIWYKSLIYALLIILFYPIIPIIAKLVLIWMRPTSNEITEEYLEAKYVATIAYAIHGCVSSPIQLCYQCWLLLKGVVPWDLGYLTFDLSAFDWSNNDGKIQWPSTPLCLIFSILT